MTIPMKPIAILMNRKTGRTFADPMSVTHSGSVKRPAGHFAGFDRIAARPIAGLAVVPAAPGRCERAAPSAAAVAPLRVATSPAANGPENFAADCVAGWQGPPDG